MSIWKSDAFSPTISHFMLTTHYPDHRGLYIILGSNWIVIKEKMCYHLSDDGVARDIDRIVATVYCKSSSRNEVDCLRVTMVGCVWMI